MYEPNSIAETDLVSVIVPVYNCENTLEEAVESILNQTYKNLEIILVNDGSTDTSLSIIESYKQKHSNIIAVDKPNGGVSSARNAGLAVSTGEYVCFCDADDKYYPNFVEIMHRHIASDGLDWVSCNFAYLEKDKLTPRTPRLKAGIYNNSDLVDAVIDDGTMGGPLISSACTRIYRHSTLKENNLYFDESVVTNEDIVFNLNWFLHTERIKFIDDILYIYRRSPFSGKKRFQYDDTFGPADRSITELCKGRIDSFDEQMRARKVSVAAWTILVCIQKYTLKSAFEGIKKIVLDESLQGCFEHIKVSQLSRKRRIVYTLLKKKRYKTIFLIFAICKYLRLL